MRRVFAALGVLALVGCIEPGGPDLGNASFAVVPDFGDYAAFTNHVEQLVIIVERGNTTDGFQLVVQDTVDIDPVTGEAQLQLTVPLFSNPATFRITLQAIRGNGDIVFEGVSIQQITAAGGSTDNTITIPITYTGPQAASVVISPGDTSLTAGASYTLVATTYDAGGAVMTGVPVTFEFVDAADANVVTLARLTGTVLIPAGTPNQEVFMYARTPGDRRDTTRLFVGATPAAVVATPGYANVGVGGTTQLSGTILDGGGNPIPFSGAFSWGSSDGAVASVDGNGLVTGNGVGMAIITVSASGFTDSIAVNVVAAGTVPVSAMGVGRAFAEVANGATIMVDVVVDMLFTGGEALGSYNATYDWDPSNFQYVGITGGDMPNPTVNPNNAGSGTLRFANIDFGGLAGQVVIARIELRALSTGTHEPTLTISELSAAQTFTNLISNVMVVQGDITVR